MTETKPMPFDEFRVSHDELLRRQREHLRDDAAAEAVLRDGAAARGWPEWPSAIPAER